MLLGICTGAEGKDADEETDSGDEAESMAWGLHAVSFLKSEERSLKALRKRVEFFDHLLHVNMRVQSWMKSHGETFENDDEIHTGRPLYVKDDDDCSCLTSSSHVSMDALRCARNRGLPGRSDLNSQIVIP